MRISSISAVQPRVLSSEVRTNQKNNVSNSNNLTFGYYGTPRGKVSGWTIAGTILGGVVAGVLTGGASVIVQAAAMTAGVIGGAAAGEATNDKLNKKEDE